jgi:hypothetical protein
MSIGHSCKFSKTGGKCPTDILSSFHKKEENVPLSFYQVFTKRRKMSHGHSDKISQKGGKCPEIILTNFQKKEENVPRLFWQIFKNEGKHPQVVWQDIKKRRKISIGYSCKFSITGGKCP